MSFYRPMVGVREDFNSLLTDFVATKSVRFAEFVLLWRARKMPLIFSGRQDDRECREFTEECFRIAAEFWMPPYSFQTRIAAIYLLFGLYHKQLFTPRAKIRVTQEMWAEALVLIEEVHAQQHFDVEFIFLKLRHDCAFHFIANLKQKNLCASTGDNAAPRVIGESVLKEPVASGLDLLMESPAVQNLRRVHDLYVKTKTALGCDDGRDASSLGMINGSLTDNITKLVTIHHKWREATFGKAKKKELTASLEVVEPVEKEDASSRARSIKSRAYAAVNVASRSRRHRQAVGDDTEGVAVSGSPAKRRKTADIVTTSAAFPSPADADAAREAGCSRGADVDASSASRPTSALLQMPELTPSDDRDDDAPNSPDGNLSQESGVVASARGTDEVGSETVTSRGSGGEKTVTSRGSGGEKTVTSRGSGGEKTVTSRGSGGEKTVTSRGSGGEKTVTSRGSGGEKTVTSRGSGGEKKAGRGRRNSSRKNQLTRRKHSQEKRKNRLLKSKSVAETTVTKDQSKGQESRDKGTSSIN